MALTADQVFGGSNPLHDLMKRTETSVVKEEIEETKYFCDKCAGRNHEPFDDRDALHLVAFGADAHTTVMVDDGINGQIFSEHEYVFCDDCIERAHEYFVDFL